MWFKLSGAVNICVGILQSLFLGMYFYLTDSKLKEMYATLNVKSLPDFNTLPLIIVGFGLINILLGLANITKIFKEKQNKIFAFSIGFLIFSFIFMVLFTGLAIIFALAPLYNIDTYIM